MQVQRYPLLRQCLQLNDLKFKILYLELIFTAIRKLHLYVINAITSQYILLLGRIANMLIKGQKICSRLAGIAISTYLPNYLPTYKSNNQSNQSIYQ